MTKINFKVLVMTVWTASAALVASANAFSPLETTRKCVDGPDCTYVNGGACLNFQDLTKEQACQKLLAINEPPRCPAGTLPCNKCAKNSEQGKCGEILQGYKPECKDFTPGGGEWHHMEFQRDADAHCKVLCCPGTTDPASL